MRYYSDLEEFEAQPCERPQITFAKASQDGGCMLCDSKSTGGQKLIPPDYDVMVVRGAGITVRFCWSCWMTIREKWKSK